MYSGKMRPNCKGDAAAALSVYLYAVSTAQAPVESHYMLLQYWHQELNAKRKTTDTGVIKIWSPHEIGHPG